MSASPTRAASSDPKPHRDLIRLTSNVQRGADVRELEGKGRLRLEARDLHHGRQLGRDGILTPAEFDALEVAARYLGALESSLDAVDRSGRPILTVGVQRLIVDPGSRSAAQRDRAAERMEALVRARELRDEKPSTVGGFSASQRHEVRERFEGALRLALNHKAQVHYTQGSRRWDGIALNRRSAEGEFPNYADCSSLTTWALWNALTGVAGMDFPDVVNGAGWDFGYTGSQSAHGRVVSFGSLEVGDLIFYGPAWPYGHVAGYVGDGLVISHGGEAGPHLLRWDYRSDVSHARRYF